MNRDQLERLGVDLPATDVPFKVDMSPNEFHVLVLFLLGGVLDAEQAAAAAVATGSGAVLGVTITQTQVVLAAAGASTILAAANANRKSLGIFVKNAGEVLSLSFGATAAVAGTGLSLGTTEPLGVAYTWDGPAVPKNAVNGISTAGATVIVWEGL